MVLQILFQRVEYAVKAFEEYREKSLDFLSPSGEFGQNNIINYNDKVFIKQIDSRYKHVLEIYNNLVLDEKRGSKILFDSVGRLINERLSSYNDISKVYSTKFGQKYVFKPTELPNVDMSPLAL